MIVEFKNTFHVPGFGRRRFERGVVYDVPDALKTILPTSAKILPSSFAKDKEQEKAKEELHVADLARAASEGTAQKALEQAGMAGYVDASDEAPVDAEPEVQAKRSPGRPRKKRGFCT